MAYAKQRDIAAKQEEAETHAGRIRERARAIRGGQRAQMANAGVYVDTGSAQHILDQTNFLAERDVLAVAYSAASYTNARQHESSLGQLLAGSFAKQRAAQAESALISGYTKTGLIAAQGAVPVYNAYQSYSTASTAKTAAK